MLGSLPSEKGFETAMIDGWQVCERVAHDRIDDEVVAIQLETGEYFSMRGAAADLWAAFATGTDEKALAAAIWRQANLNELELESSIKKYVSELQEASLIERAQLEHASEAVLLTPFYDGLVVERFTDMQELMLLDPVHDVEPESGWPFKASTSLV